MIADEKYLWNNKKRGMYVVLNVFITQNAGGNQRREEVNEPNQKIIINLRKYLYYTMFVSDHKAICLIIKIEIKSELVGLGI